MALTKETNNKASDVIQLISPMESRRIPMGIDPEGMAHIIERLTSLYTNPIAATVRELVSNAVDATALLPEGERQPVKVTTPSAFQTFFTVEDFGVGMSLEVVESIYSHYGASTKTKDMRQIGAYGLGAKSPLAYCNEFSLETTRDGMTTLVSVARESEGNAVNVLSHERTGKPNGTKVTVPSRHADTEKFSQALETYRNYSFDVPMLIDEKPFDASNFVILNENFVLDADSETFGRIWIKKSHLANFMLAKAHGSTRFDYTYVLSGWAYNPTPNHGYRYGSQGKHIVVELKPGVVDFSSSRDEITMNDRLTSLNKQVELELRAFDDEAIERTMKIYRTFDNEEARRFFSQILLDRSVVKSVEGYKLVYSAYGYKRSKIDISGAFFTTDSGFNPFQESLEHGYKPNLLAGFTVASKEPSLFTDIDSSSADQIHQKIPFAHRNVSISMMNDEIKTDVAAGESKFALYDLIVFQSIRASQYPHPDLKSKILVVTYHDELSVKRILANRKLLADTMYGNWMLFFNGGTEEELDRQIAAAQQFSPASSIEKKTANDLLEELKEVRKSLAPAAKTATGGVIRVSVVTEGEALEAKVVDGRSVRTNVSTTADEIMNKNAIVVLYTNDYRRVLIGAANSGIKITDRPVYVVHSSDTPYVKDLEKLKNHKGLMFSQDYKPRSNLAKELVKTQTYHGDVLDSQLDNLSDEDFVKTWLSYAKTNMVFIAEFSAWLSANGSEDTELQRLLALAEDPKARSHYIRPTDSQLKARFKGADSLITLTEAASTATRGYSFSARVYSSLLQTHRFSDSERRLAHFLFEELRKKMEEIA